MKYPILTIGKTEAVAKVWMTRKDAATYLGVSTDYIKSLCNDRSSAGTRWVAWH